MRRAPPAYGMQVHEVVSVPDPPALRAGGGGPSWERGTAIVCAVVALRVVYALSGPLYAKGALIAVMTGQRAALACGARRLLQLGCAAHLPAGKSALLCVCARVRVRARQCAPHLHAPNGWGCPTHVQCSNRPHAAPAL